MRRKPQVAELLPLPFITAAIAVAPLIGVDSRAAFLAGFIGLVGAGAIGVPILSWALAHGWTGFLHLVGLGAAGGALGALTVFTLSLLSRELLGARSWILLNPHLPAGEPLLVVTSFCIIGTFIGVVAGAIYWLSVLSPMPRWLGIGISVALLFFVSRAFG
jgi:hypothetical protein